MPVIKLAIKELQNAKFYTIFLVSVMFVAIFSLSPVISSLMNNVIIRSSGRIATIAPVAYKSEIRGVFVHCATFSAYPTYPDWDLIAQTCKDYGINAIYGEFLSSQGGYYDSELFETHYGNQLGMAIDACHSRGIEVHVSMDVVYPPVEDQYKAVHSDGSLASWGCPIRLRPWLKLLVEELVTKYDIDGFMFDYTRFDTTDMCYCDQCKAAFEEWLGETITDWTPFYPGGSRNLEFLEWRNIPITELVRDMRNWMSAIKPDLEFSSAAWTCFEDYPIYWIKYLGQDTGDWIRRGYLDMVSPMVYTTDLAAIEGDVTTDFKYWSGPEGKIPLAVLVTNTLGEPAPTPEEFKAVVDKVRSLGADGWIIWRYGGPGASPDVAPDIRDYLSIIDMPPVFTLENIEVSPSATEATITWTTDLPATSKVEYNTSSLFIANFYPGWRGDEISYWDIDHVPGTVVEDNTTVTSHSITLTDLLPETKYYFRVQSRDPSGIATSKVLTFMTES